MWGFKHQCYLHIYFDIPLRFVWIFFFSDTSLFIKLSSAEGMCNSETGCKGKSTMFQQADLRMMALMFVVCVYLQMLFMFIGKGDNKKLVIGISSGFLFFSAAVYRLEAIILR